MFVDGKNKYCENYFPKQSMDSVQSFSKYQDNFSQKSNNFFFLEFV